MKTAGAFFVAVLLVFAGCDKSNGPTSTRATNGVVVDLVASSGASGGAIRLAKTTGGDSPAGVDSIVIQGAELVLKDIVLTADVDTMHARDSAEVVRDDDREEHDRGSSNGGDHGGDHGGNNGDDHVTDHGGQGSDDVRVLLKGPFVVPLQNNQPTVISTDTIPAGIYDGIKFAVHNLRTSDVTNNPALPDSLVGFSVVVVGTVIYNDTTQVPFVFKTNINQDFKVKGNFIVNPFDTQVPFALDFNLEQWFRSDSGKLLDPTNMFDRMRIREEIREVLGARIRGGCDRNHDGRPD